MNSGRKPSILFLRADHGACSYYRCVLPAKALAERGYRVLVDDHTTNILDYDVIVYQRQTATMHIGVVQELRRHGKKVVYDIDDNAHHLQPDNPVSYSFSEDVHREARWSIEQMMAHSNAVTVTTKALAKQYSRFNPNIHVLPNSIDRDTLAREKAQSDRLVVGWQGTATHYGDLKSIRSVVNEALGRFDFEFVLAGFSPPLFRKATFRPWVRFDERTLAHYGLFQDFDIGLCPLLDNRFNECKSDIKFLEYSSLGIPAIATKVAAYSTIRHGVTGLIARNLGEWERNLEALIKDETRRKELGRAAKEYATAERTIQGNIRRWEELYRNL